MVDAGRAALGDLDERGREVAGPRRAAALVGDDADLVARLREGEHGVDEVRAPGAVQPCRAADRVRGAGLRDGSLAGELGAPVGGPRRPRVGLDVRARRVAGEDVVGGDVDQEGSGRRARRGHVARRGAVDQRGEVLGGLGAVDVGVGRAVDDRVGTLRRESLADRLRVGQVEVVDVRSDRLVAALARHRDDAMAEHPGGAGHEHLHQRIPISLLSPTMKR